MCILDVSEIYLGVSTIGFIYIECMLKYPKTDSVSRKYLCIIKLYPVLKYPKKENIESIYVSYKTVSFVKIS